MKSILPGLSTPLGMDHLSLTEIDLAGHPPIFDRKAAGKAVIPFQLDHIGQGQASNRSGEPLLLGQLFSRHRFLLPSRTGIVILKHCNSIFLFKIKIYSLTNLLIAISITLFYSINNRL